MTGKLGLIEPEIPKHRHDHFIMSLDSRLDCGSTTADGLAVLRSGRPCEASRLETEFSLREGVEPFGADFTPEKLLALAGGRRVPVKSFLIELQNHRRYWQHLRQ